MFKEHTLPCAFAMAHGTVCFQVGQYGHFALCYGKSTPQSDHILAVFLFFLVYAPKTHIYHNRHHRQFIHITIHIAGISYMTILTITIQVHTKSIQVHTKFIQVQMSWASINKHIQSIEVHKRSYNSLGRRQRRWRQRQTICPPRHIRQSHRRQPLRRRPLRHPLRRPLRWRPLRRPMRCPQRRRRRHVWIDGPIIGCCRLILHIVEQIASVI